MIRFSAGRMVLLVAQAFQHGSSNIQFVEWAFQPAPTSDEFAGWKACAHDGVTGLNIAWSDRALQAVFIRP